MWKYPCGTVVVLGDISRWNIKAGHGMLDRPKIKNLESPLMRYVHINETRTTLPPIEGSIGLKGFCGAAEVQATTRGAPQVGMNGIDQNISDMEEVTYPFQPLRRREEHASEVTIRITKRQLHELMEKRGSGHGLQLPGLGSRRSTEQLLADIMNSGEVHHHHHREEHLHWKPALQSIPEAVES
ncbi:hypothetical protein C2845_PM08G28050 [Panicum miliaceum]|uniref:Uncharacterized protein n=1 Tax=Panicum miliaceum TaxID=4540 RepID=A0A3L6QXG3_PANMI|nr:hypothetical protein C2845_PM08G28050 [Panicum miliaceum]